MANTAALATTKPAPSGLSHVPFVGSSPVGKGGTKLAAITAFAGADRVANRAGKIAPSKPAAAAGLALGLMGGPKYRELAETLLVGSCARYAVQAGERAGDAVADAAGLPLLSETAPNPAPVEG